MATRFLMAAEGDTLSCLVDSTAAMNGVELVGTATSHAELVESCSRLRPDVALVDMALLEGEQPLAELHRRSPATRVVVVAARLNGAGPDPGRALKWGASGVVYRDASAAELVPVFEHASRLSVRGRSGKGPKNPPGQTKDHARGTTGKPETPPGQSTKAERQDTEKAVTPPDQASNPGTGETNAPDEGGTPPSADHATSKSSPGTEKK